MSQPLRPQSPEIPARPEGAARPGDASIPPSSAPKARRARSPLTALLLLLVAALVLTTGVLVADRHRLTAEFAGAQSALEAARAAQSTAQAEAQAAAGSTASGEGAPSETNPGLLEVIRKQARRDPADAQAQGAVDAPVVMVLYSDFACPYCTLFAKQVEPGLADLVKDGTLRIEWRDLAQITPTSPLAAQAGRAAAAQGRFWEFHDAVYAAAGDGEHPEYTEDNLTEFAKAAGVPDLDAFRLAMTSAETEKAVTDAKTEAYNLGITGTPFMFIGEAYISGYRDLKFVRATVESQAEALK
ncbi:DsbA family protein [Actinomyces culturomici]|uniref:DsbA family protein n=1 Tax=Actinomyces culturomici TaxID=1926276 RepID=UPI001F25D70F|nr:thioredoxin domain-containing protein [Actinomyces culturomici]